MPWNLRSLADRFGYRSLISISLVYFSQGFREISVVARLLYFKTVYGLDPAKLTSLSTLLFISWYLKPIIGLISDTYFIFGYKRKSYLVLASLIGLISSLYLLYTTNLYLAICCLVLSEFSQSTSDVIIDGFVVEQSKKDLINGSSDLQKICWASLFFSSMLGIISGGILSDFIQPVEVLSSLSFCSALVLISAFVLPEDKSQEENGKITKQLKEIWSSLSDKVILRVIAFTVLWRLTNISFENIYQYFILDILGLSPSTLSLIIFTGYIGSFFGTVFADSDWLKMGTLKKFILGRVLHCFINTLDIVSITRFYENLDLPVYPFLFGSHALGNAIEMYFSRMPIMVMHTQITPKSIEASFYSLLASCYNFSWSLSSNLSSLIMYSTSINTSSSPYIWVLPLISISIYLISIPLVLLIPNTNLTPKQKELEMPLIK